MKTPQPPNINNQSKVFHTIHPDTTIGAVSLTIPDLERSIRFYQDVLGMPLLKQEGHAAHLGAGDRELLILAEEPGAQRPPNRSTGLYHIAIRVPSRLDLARALHWLAEANFPPQGFANHGVSEAIYLADPDGNGIEIYRDYPRRDWPYRHGQLQMVTDPLDVQGLLSELRDGVDSPPPAMHPDTILGHIHLKVSDINKSQDFYCRVLGFDLVQRYGSSACFVSAGGYHHHIGMNTWESAGAPPSPEGTIGMRYFSVQLPDPQELERVLTNVRAAGLIAEKQGRGFLVRDPSQNGVFLTN